jgi:hypothetical protein
MALLVSCRLIVCVSLSSFLSLGVLRRVALGGVSDGPFSFVSLDCLRFFVVLSFLRGP